MKENNKKITPSYIQKELFKLKDLKYQKFQAKLIPNINPETIIGVRTPELRRLAGGLFKESDCRDFLDILPHKYYEENNLHGFLIEKIKNYDEMMERLEAFLPYIDNWATCDLIRPKLFKNHLPELFPKIEKWINSAHTYTVRFAVGMLMSFYLDSNFSERYLKMVSKIKSEDYYVNMMIAWYFATALAKQYEFVVKYIEEKTLSRWVHNKTIQKAIESYRISEDKKQYLKTLKIKD